MYNQGQPSQHHQHHMQYHQQNQQGYYPPPPPPQQQQQQQSGYYQQQPPQQQGYGQPPPQQGYGQPPPAPPVPQQPQQQQQQQGGLSYLPPSVGQQQQQPPQGPPPQQTSAEDEASLRQWFDAVDTAKTGSISSEDLSKALSSAGYKFRAGTAERLVRLYDKDQSNKIEFQEFKAAHAFIKSMSQGFAKRDADGSGVLEGPEVRAALAASGFRLSDPAHQLIMRKFSRGGGGGLHFDDYIDLSIILGTSAKVFAFYDKGRNGVGSGLVTFDFSTWLVSVLACLV